LGRLLFGSRQRGDSAGPDLNGRLACWSENDAGLGLPLAATPADLGPKGVGRSPRRPVAEGAIFADASAVAIENRMSIPPNLALPLAYLTPAGWALGHLRRVRAGLDRFSVDLGFKHWLLPVPSWGTEPHDVGIPPLMSASLLPDLPPLLGFGSSVGFFPLLLIQDILELV
jgi:hypothetical protein